MSLEEYKGVYVFAQQIDNHITEITYELMGKAIELAKDLGTEVVAVLCGHEIENKVFHLKEHGADRVILIDDPELKEYRTEPYAHALSSVINEYKPDMICFRRNCLVRIVAYAEKHNMPLWKPKLYCPISEMVDDVTRKLLKKTLGDGLIDAYGLSEMGSFVYQYPGNDFYYVANDIAVVNVYDDNNNLADDGRIIITSLYKKTYPIINYETRDLGKSYIKDGLRYMTKIEGRMNDLVLHEDGVESSALMLMRIANKTVGLSQFRFIEETYHDMLIQLAPDPNNTSMSREEIEKHFIDSVYDLYGDEFKVRIEWMDVLPPDTTGKQRCFVCNVKKEQ